MVARLIRTCRTQYRCSLFLFLTGIIPFWEKLFQKDKIVNSRLKSGILTNSNLQNSMVVFNLFVLDWKNPFWISLVQKTKIVSSTWNLVPELIRLCRIKWRCLSFFFCFGPRKTFLSKFAPKIKIFSLRRNLILIFIWITRIQWHCSLFVF